MAQSYNVFRLLPNFHPQSSLKRKVSNPNISSPAQCYYTENAFGSNVRDGAYERIDGGSSGDDIIDNQDVFPVQLFWVFHLKYALDILHTFSRGEVSLCTIVLDSYDAGSVHVNLCHFTDSLGYLLTLIVASVLVSFF